MEASITLNDEVVQAALKTAVLTAIGKTGQEAIIKYVVDYLTRSSKDNYGRMAGPLYDIINREADKIAREMIDERLKTDETLTKHIEQLFVDGMKRFMEGDRDKVVQSIADSLRKAVTGDRY